MVTGLNWLRGIAAILVLLSHARPFFFVNYPDLAVPAGPIGKAFYLMSGLGVSAVMIFFVLSGYLVAGSAHRAMSSGSWSWRVYLVTRLTRLWVVLLPCLALTLLCDLLGRHIFGSSFYEGVLVDIYFSGPSGNADLSFGAFLGNLLFLQTIVVPTYGSNGPLWSISYEFWYYMLFPALMLMLWSGKSAGLRASILGAAVLLAILVGPKVMLLFPIWLMGFGAWYLRDCRLSKLLAQNCAISVVAVVFLVGILLFARASGLHYSLAMRYLLGLATALAIPALHHPIFTRGSRLADGLSAGSYSLYLSHFPVLALLAAATGNHRSQTLMAGMPVFLAGLVLAALVAAAVYKMFEQHTPILKNALLPQLKRG
ncbi:acyltransferase [Pseudophaeobacter sp.]|uniref:acyltransferase family protein n=1 Tax=Pseudophaeobacter sp. TaxID=1971739 RepID=UPI003299394D